MTENNKTEKKKNRSRRWVTLLILLVIAAAVFFFFRIRQQQAIQNTLANLKTAPLSRETLNTTISGTGTVRPKQSALLVWQSSGTVGEVLVEARQTVKAGDVLMNLDPEDLPAELLQAKLNQLNASQALEQLDVNTDLQRLDIQNNIAQTQQTLLSLNNQILNYEGRVCEEWRFRNLQRDYDNALKEYQDWPTETKWYAVQAARAALDYCDPVVIEGEIASLQAKIDLANKNIELLQTDLEKIKDGVDPEEKEKLELQLALAEEQLSFQFITAPFDGTILAVNQEVGAVVSPGMQAVEIADLDAYFVDIPVSEVDIPNIELGQIAQLSFDAYYEENFSGQVVTIAESGDRSTGVVNYIVTIEMDLVSKKIKPGMTAGVQILTEEKPNVLVVASEAVFSKDGQDYVYVLRDNVLVSVPVKVGAYSNRMVELTEADIEEGELIVLNPPVSLFDRFGPGNHRR
jgi:HlyD family secretion protein